MLRLRNLLQQNEQVLRRRIHGLNRKVRPEITTSLLADLQHPRLVHAKVLTKEKATPQKLTISDFTEGKEIEGFVVQQVTDIPVFRLKALRLIHKKTGAQYLHIHREDSNNVFSVGFRTTPNNSTGLPHILEHTTLCGSKKYPCRDPFFKMLNRSLATFMNAMTGPDYTMYPFASQNEKDYANLMSVYLDAVYRPQLRDSDFRQEGWRLEHKDVNDPKSPIIFKGVVFNEMKGVFAENQSVFEQKLLNSILPSNTYGFVSGGDPLHIPSLTHEDLKAFHRKYYSPSNSHIYSYGNFPLQYHLKYINENYFENIKNVSANEGKETSVPAEKRWDTPRSKHTACRPDPLAADPGKQSTVAVSVLCSDIINIQETFELQVLAQLLIKGPNSPMYKSLVEPNIGAGFSPATGYESQTRDTIFTVGLQGVDPKDFDKIVAIYDKTLSSAIDVGFESEQVEAILHEIELGIKHQSANFGLQLLFGLVPIWNHDADVVKALQIEEQAADLKKKLKDNPKYLQDLIVKHMKQNSHRLVLTMSPEEEYEAKLAQAEQKLLKAKVDALSGKDKEKIFKEGLKLKEEQQKTEDISSLPTLHIEDLKKEIEFTQLREELFASVPVQVCAQPTNGMTYFRGILNTRDLRDDLKPLLPLFCSVAGKMGTSRHNYREFDQLVQLKTGGLSLSNHIGEDAMDTVSFEEGILFGSNCLDKNVKDMFCLWAELFNGAAFQDMKRFETLVRVSAAELVNGIMYRGHHYAMSSAASFINPSSERKELLGGLTHVIEMKKIAQMEDLSPVLNQMREIACALLNKKHLRCAVNLCPESEAQILQQVESFLGNIPGTPGAPQLKTSFPEYYLSSAEPKAVHHIHPIGVNYVAKAISSVYYCHAHFPALRVLARILTSKYLHPRIREMGGAYGSGLSLSHNGVLNFYSYRDPNFTETIEAFNNAHAWVKENKFEDQDIKEAKLGVFQTIDAPIPPSAKGMNKFLFGIDDLLLQMHRSALKKVSREELLEVADAYLGPKSKSRCGFALLGPENETVKQKKGFWTFVTHE